MRSSRSMLKNLTLRRLGNAVKVFSSFYWSKWNKKPRQWGMPIAISIEPTTSCNLRCPECPSGLRKFSRPTGMLDPEFFRRTVDAMQGHLLYLNFYFQGEPYLHPAFTELVKYASSKKIFTSTSTNAHFLDKETAKKTVESGLDRLIISIDGTTQETYSSYRIGGKLDKVLEGTRNIIEAKKELRSNTPHVIFQFLVVKPNEHQVKDVKLLAEKMGVNEVAIKTAQVYEYENGNELIPDEQEYSRYRKTANGKWELKSEMEDHCWRMWHSCVITWDGGVVPCCFDKDGAHRLGTLQHFSMKEIWFSEPYKKFRGSVLKGRKEIDICRNCSEGTKVWATEI